MIMIEFSDGDKAALSHGRYHEPHAFVRQKMEVLWLKSLGLAHSDICRLAGVCSSTLTTYVREYQEGGIEALRELSFRRPRHVIWTTTATCLRRISASIRRPAPSKPWQRLSS